MTCNKCGAVLLLMITFKVCFHFQILRAASTGQALETDQVLFCCLFFFLSERINGVISEMIPGDQQYSSPYRKFN